MLIIGPPGSGKGTQAERLSASLGVAPISTGYIFRANVRDRTPLGVAAAAYLDNGDLVPDEITNAMVRSRLGEDDAREGFLLDGYPRTVAQVEELDDILAGHGQELDLVLQLSAGDEELVRRLLGRAKDAGRSDDTEKVIRHRLALYHGQTEAVLTRYAERGQLVRVDGFGAVDTVSERVLRATTLTSGRR
ncbi:adenylate kinase [Pseudarthrobacter enclensis]|nr:adenylate kinase [Pseudarthrobacter enclensis]